MISLIFRHEQAFLPLPPNENAIGQKNLSSRRLVRDRHAKGMPGGKVFLAAYGRKAVFYL
jgi:hypothetical protein